MGKMVSEESAMMALKALNKENKELISEVDSLNRLVTKLKFDIDIAKRSCDHYFNLLQETQAEFETYRLNNPPKQ